MRICLTLKAGQWSKDCAVTDAEATYKFEFPAKIPASLSAAVLSNVLRTSRNELDIVRLWRGGVLLRDAMVDLLLSIEGKFYQNPCIERD